MIKKLMTKSDWIVIGLICILSVSLYFSFNYFNGQQGNIAHVYYDNQLVATLDLNENINLILKKNKYPMLLDDLEVSVKDGYVSITKETSPNNICSKQGKTNSPINPLVCLPNHVVVQIESQSLQENGLDSVVK